MTNTFYLVILMMVSSLFSACDSDDKSETAVPPSVEEEPDEPNQPSGEMGDPSQTQIYLWIEGNMPATSVPNAGSDIKKWLKANDIIE